MADTTLVRRPPPALPQQQVRVYTVEEAAAVLRMSRASLYRLVRDGKVPHRKIGSTGVRFSDADLRSILEDAHRPVVV